MTIYPTKICTKCKCSKPLEEFYKEKRAKDGRFSSCKKCEAIASKTYRQKNRHKVLEYGRRADVKQMRLNSHLLIEYGITLEQYNLLFESQKGCCSGCLRHQSELKQRLSVDHNHTTGKVRGLLCLECNFILGKAKDSSDTLIRLAKYLISPS